MKGKPFISFIEIETNKNEELKDDFMKLKLRFFALLILGILLATGCKHSGERGEDLDIQEPAEKTPMENDEYVKVDLIQKKIDNMSIDEKIGQLIMTGFEGTSLGEDLIQYIKEYKVGGVIFFSRNIEDFSQAIELINQIKTANKSNSIPLLLSIDEEGGRVSRFPKSIVGLPGAKTIGDKNDHKISYGFGKVIGDRLKNFGFNMVYGPVLDINSNPRNSVIGDRAFGSNPSLVSEVGVQVIDGIKRTNIISVAKHFPGHGGTEMDSHIDLPTFDKSFEELLEFELIPFAKAIENSVDAIMVAHILYPKIDSKFPATMSNIIINDILREKLKFEGLVLSDDMTMGAIVNNFTVEEGALKFLQAGGDIVLICHGKDNTIKSINRILEAVENGELNELEIDKKVYRILELKERYELEDIETYDNSIQRINDITKEFNDKLQQ